MTHAIRIENTGGTEVLKWTEVADPVPGAGEALIRQTAVGVNFIDIYQRSGLYKLNLPLVLGQEGAGVVEAIGPGVSEVKVGDRVVYQGALGGYAEKRTIAADRLIPVPDSVSDKVAAASCLKGLTAYYLLRQTFEVKPGHTVLFHAAAGGVGTIACQWAKALGATVIGTVGSAAKAELARANGCDHVINYAEEDFVARVLEITDGKKCDVVYDSVGKDTFPGSLDCIKPRGMWVSFGQSSGTPPDFPILLLHEKGSIYATRPTTGAYLGERDALLKGASELFGHIADGTVRVDIGQEFALKDAALAHEALAGRKTTGATVLIP